MVTCAQWTSTEKPSIQKVPGSLPLYIPEEQLLFLLSGHDHVLRHQVVLSDVDQQLRLQELEINTETISQSN